MPVSKGIWTVVEGDPVLTGAAVPFVDEADSVVGGTLSVVQAANKAAMNKREATNRLTSN